VTYRSGAVDIFDVAIIGANCSGSSLAGWLALVENRD
jgi:flavin-dependent dehydrogenase